MPGRFGRPTPTGILVPVELFGVPMAAHQAPPRSAMSPRRRASRRCSPWSAGRDSRWSTGKGGRMRGVPRLPSSDSISADSLAADVGAGAEVDGDVEVEAAARDVAAEQLVRAREHGLEAVEQVAVFAAQV